MLVDLLYALPRAVVRWLAHHLGVEAGLHEWAHNFCVCDEAHQ